MIKRGMTPRFAEIGKIKIGGKGETKKSANGKDFSLPVRYDHFKITTTEKDSNGNFVINDEIMTRLDKNKKPKEIPIRLLFDDIDLNFFTSFQFYSGAKLQCKGDGLEATWFLADGKTKQGECNPEKCEHALTGKCKISGILSCILSDLPQFGGVYRFRTHGWNSVSNILASLQFISQNTNGILAGIPLRLKILKKVTAEHGTVHTVTVIFDSTDQIRKQAIEELNGRKLLNVDIKKLENVARASDFVIDKDEPADVAAEWYPEEEEKGVGADDLKNILSKPRTTMLD